jgi:anti-sigma28 factor (negative regulator of flagellin synthesis)
MYGIGGVSEPRGSDPGLLSGRTGGKPRAADPAHDGVAISPEAREASQAQRLLGASEEVARARQERIDRARESIEAGTYKVVEVVRMVASRVSRYMPE